MCSGNAGVVLKPKLPFMDAGIVVDKGFAGREIFSRRENFGHKNGEEGTSLSAAHRTTWSRPRPLPKGPKQIRTPHSAATHHAKFNAALYAAQERKTMPGGLFCGSNSARERVDIQVYPSHESCKAYLPQNQSDRTSESASEAPGSGRVSFAVGEVELDFCALRAQIDVGKEVHGSIRGGLIFFPGAVGAHTRTGNGSSPLLQSADFNSDKSEVKGITGQRVRKIRGAHREIINSVDSTMAGGSGTELVACGMVGRTGGSADGASIYAAALDNEIRVCLLLTSI
ncbi:hypothetical protein DFH06DRAFT_1149927 [Mycena polygramma]|nr:hypothetical protein DFH06DRAFT_1149927 [Mycena polygramma]